jgi:hypothetical protein
MFVCVCVCASLHRNFPMTPVPIHPIRVFPGATTSGTEGEAGEGEVVAGVDMMVRTNDEEEETRGIRGLGTAGRI